MVALAAPPAAALEFGFEPATRFGAGPQVVMTLRGEVLEGDLARLQRFVAVHRDRWIEHGGTVVPVIDGGDVEEAIAIGAFLRDALSEMRVPDTGSSRCTSACFFLLAQAVERRAVPGTVGVHRPWFEPATLAGATPDAARLRYAGLLADLRGRLLDWMVPQALIERMFATPSSALYWLSAGDLGLLGSNAPWFAEYAAARCGLDGQASANLAELRLLGDEAAVAVLERSEREAAACLSELRRQARARLPASTGD
jgi:hypothetical protein